MSKRRPLFYTLVNHRPVPVKTQPLHTWTRWMKEAVRDGKRRVAYDEIKVGRKKVEVSTVFLGIDHNFLGRGTPILFETMVFGGRYDKEMYRYTTWKKAEEGHKKVLDKVRRSLRNVSKD